MTSKIDIIVQSKYSEVLKEFIKTYLPSIKKFPNLTTHYLTGDEFGARAINKILKSLLITKEWDRIFGVFNDDLWFDKYWLEDVMKKFKIYDAVSPGYIETTDFEKFVTAVERTKKEEETVKHTYGPVQMFKLGVFYKIGVFDEGFNWSCDDLDLSWRMYLRKLSAVTSKKVTVAHRVGTTRNRTRSQRIKWSSIFKDAKQRFYDKHGYRSYREIREQYLEYHRYFRQFV